MYRYFAIDWDLVWDVATRDVPELRRQILTVLQAEFPLVARALETEGEAR